MTPARACVPCRSAKTECDHARPTCSRCTQLRLICSGLPLNAAFVFRDQNEVAQRNSQRARRQKRQNPASTASVLPIATYSRSRVAGAETDGSSEQYPWLSARALAEVPEPLKRDLDARALERFFVNWTLHPSDHGVSPGHMPELPPLFFTASPDSVLSSAVRALAFADMGNANSGDGPFSTKARQQYGAALNRVRAMINNHDELDNDHVLSAILLIDNFEIMYLARSNPVGPHTQAIRYILQKRGNGQLYSPTRFSLWRSTHYRLQSWQTLFHEQPDFQQISWVGKLNLEQPDLRICSHVLHMNILSAAAKTITRPTENTEEKIKQARQLAREMQDLTVAVEAWAAEMAQVWNAKVENPDNIAHPQDVGEPPGFPMPQFPYPRLISHEDLHLAYIWNFYAASQIALRESLVDVIHYMALLQKIEVPDKDRAVIRHQRDWVDVLSGAIIGSFPMLLGFTPTRGKIGGPRFLRQGRMAGRLFAIFSMWIVLRAQFTSAQHKQTAAEVVTWINVRHKLG